MTRQEATVNRLVGALSGLCGALVGLLSASGHWLLAGVLFVLSGLIWFCQELDGKHYPEDASGRRGGEVG